MVETVSSLLSRVARSAFKSSASYRGYLSILAVAMLSLSWFRGGLIEFLDFDLPPGQWLLPSSLFMWENSATALGLPNYRNTAAIGFSSFLYLAEMAGLSQLVSEMVLFYLLFASSGISMYFLFSVLFPTHRGGAIASSLFYMMNSYTMVYVWGQLSGFIFAYAFQPLLLGMFIRGLRGGKAFPSALSLTLVWWITAGNAYGNPELLLINVFPLMGYLAVHLVMYRQRNERLRAVRFLATLSLIWTGINAYWIIPWAFFLSEAYRAAGYLQLAGSTDLGAFQGNSAPILGAMRLFGYWAINSGYRGDPYYIWAETYSSPIFTLITFLIPSIAYAPLIVPPRSKRLIVTASFTLIATLSVAGSTSLAGSSIENFLTVTSLLRIFRAPYQRFGIYLVLGHAILIGAAIGMLSHSRVNIKTTRMGLRRIQRLFPGAFSFLIIIVIAGPIVWPFWTGDVIYPGGAVIPSARVTVPAYYSEAAKWLAAQNEDFNIMTIPLQLLGGTALSWANNTQGYLAINPDVRLLPKPTIYTWQQYGTGLPGFIMDRLFLYNSGFETGDLTGWAVEAATVNVQSATVFQGNFAAQVKLDPGSHGSLYLSRAYPLSMFPSTLNFSISLLTESDAIDYRLVYWFYDAREYIGAISSQPNLADNGNWTNPSFSTSPIAGATYFRIGLTFDSGPTSGVVIVDALDQPGVTKLEKLPKLLSYLNVKYLVYNDDTNWKYVNGSSWWVPSAPNAATLLRSINGIALDKEFGKLYFYRNIDWRPMHVWATASADIVNGDFDQLLEAIQNSTRLSPVFFMTSQSDSSRLESVVPSNEASSNSPVNVSYAQVNPVRYRVDVETSSPFFLILTENYHKDWKAYLGDIGWFSPLTQSPLPDQDHLIANGFANAWYIPMTGRITISLFFWPQETYYLGVVISIATLLLCSCLILVGSLKAKRLRKHIC